MLPAARKRCVIWASALVVLAGCPKRFDPRADTIASSPNREADHEYHEAKARLDIGDHKDAAAAIPEFRLFLASNPPVDRVAAVEASLKQAEAEAAASPAKGA